MKAVVIRCPNCGTTQGALGTCDTCHEAEAAYFCPNHVPGRWIDGPACADCGARLGMGAPSPATGPVSPPPSARRPVEWRPPRRARPAAPGSTPPVRSRPRPGELDEPARGAARDPGEIDPRVLEGMDPRFVEWLEHMRRRGGPLDGPADPREAPPGLTIDPAAAVRGVARGAIGCVGRLVMVVIVIAILAMLMLGGFFGGYADLDDARAIVTSSGHVEDRHAIHLDAVPLSGQGRLDLRAGA